MLPAEWTDDDVLALSFLRSITSTSLRFAAERAASLDSLLATPELLDRCKIKSNGAFDKCLATDLREKAALQLEACAAAGVKVITFWNDAYPALLREISYPPALLFVRGQLEPDGTPVIGVVGTRKCTHYGQLAAERFASEFVSNGVVVCSGLANGIDMIAHKAAMQSGGKTYSVIASGIDRISSHYSAKIADDIAGNGAVISEYRCGVTALPAYFPQRNRIISGLSNAVVVVESALSGGALITAQFCFEQNRELFAIPGNITSEKSSGTNMLIRKNMASAALAAEDVMLSVGVNIARKAEAKTLNFAHSDEKAIYETLTYEPQQIDDIAAILAMPPQDIMSNLLMLEFKGIARQLPGKTFIRI